MAYALVFVELMQKFECYNLSAKDAWATCVPDDFCNKDPAVQYRINWNDRESLHNFVSKMELQCASATFIGYFGVCYLLGIVVGCFTLTRMGDIYGRKYVFIGGMILQICLVIGLVFSPNTILTYVLLFFFGVAITGKQFVGYAFLLEMMPSSH